MKKGVMVFIVAVFGFFVTSSFVLAQSFDWQAYSGTELRILVNQHPWTDAIAEFIPQFEEETGIKVYLDKLPESEFRTKLGIEMQSGSGSVDVFMTQTAQEGLKYGKAGWYEPLGTFVNDPALTAPDYDFADFIPTLIEANTLDGQLVGIPVQYESTTLYYRKDLFEEKGITPPTTLEELEAAAAAFNDPDNDFYGFTARGKGAAAVTQFSPILYAFGGDWLDAEGNPSINTEEAVQAFTFYGNLLKNYGPPGATSFSHPEARAVFMQGKAAMYMDASVFVSEIEDPSKSGVVGQVGYALAPGGKPYVSPAWAISMASSSQNKEAAWYFIQYMTSKEKVKATQLKRVSGGRTSVQADPEVSAAFPSDWVETFNTSKDIGIPYDRPVVVSVPEVRDVIGNVIVTAIEGGDVQAAADAANAEFAEILQNE